MNVPNDAALLREEPYYLPLADEIDVFERRLRRAPAGAAEGAHRLRQDPLRRAHGLAPVSQRERSDVQIPLITISCHEDLTATDMVGRFLLRGDETVWSDGPLTRAVRSGAICYLDEIVEARKDTTVLIHSLTDHRRLLPIDKTGELLSAHPDFLLVISYNPGYQSVLKDLKPSTRQRFVSLEFDYPDVEREAEIIAHEAASTPPRPSAWR
jgi:nitric oxide reductase NorQ protein